MRPIQLRCMARTMSGQRPARPSRRFEQLLGVVGDAQEPLLQCRAASTGVPQRQQAPFDDLLVGEHRLKMDGRPELTGASPW